jgi:Tfp pilus assembly protein PilE
MNQKGITRIEVLIIAGVIGLLGLLAVVAVTSARAKTRDAIRVSDVRQIQAGAELYFNDVSQYPQTVEPIAIGEAVTSCLTDQGFVATCSPTTEVVYLDVVPAAPKQGLKGASSCGGVRNAYCFSGSNGEYRIQFELERANSLLGLEKGVNCATESGLLSGACSALMSASEEPAS